jgi:hypothetical protein
LVTMYSNLMVPLLSRFLLKHSDRENEPHRRV